MTSPTRQANKTGAGPRRWLLFIHQLPAEPAYLRVKVGRRLARIGAVAVKNSVYVLPATDTCREDLTWTRREISDAGGEAMLFEASALEGLTDLDIEKLFTDARAKDYTGLERVLDAVSQQRDTALTVLASLEEDLRAIERIDFFPGNVAKEMVRKLAAARAALEQPAGAEEPELEKRKASSHQGRTWVTRQGVRVDRVACAWLIRRFIDKRPRFKFVDFASYKPKTSELRFDMNEAEFTHRGDLCSFEVLARSFGLVNPGLSRIAEIVHDLDIKDGRYAHPETEGVRLMIDGVVAQHPRDEDRVTAAGAVFDTLLAAHGAKSTSRKR